MTGSSQLAESPRDRFLEVAQEEMRKFELKEREFRRKARQERAAQLRLPLTKADLNS
jgi:hypothetical protein